jgi:hypothetical protein
MRKLALLLICAALLSGSLGAGVIQVVTRPDWDSLVLGPTDITFEGLTPEGGYANVPGASLTLSGATFAHLGATRPYMITVSDTYPGGNYNRGSGDSLQIGSPDYSGAGSLLRISLPAGTLALAADLYTVVGNSSNVSAPILITLSSGETYTVVTPASVPGMAFFGVISTSPIAHVDFESQDGAAFLNVDNVSFSSEAIPEPATLFMAGGALLLLGALRRRR